MKTYKLSISGMVMALYIVVMYAFQSFAFDKIQIRLATSLYALCAPFPFLVLPLSLANSLSNILMGGFGPIDMVGGFCAGLVTCSAVCLIRKLNWFDLAIAIPLILGPGLIIPLYLSYLLEQPYWLLSFSLCLGQLFPAVLGVLLTKAVDKIYPVLIGRHEI